MFEILSAGLGFLAPFLPEVLKFFTRKQDNQHELAMMDLQMRAGASEHAYKMEEIITTGDISEMTELHKPTQSFGVQLLDAAKGYNLSGWALYPAFYLFSFLDFVAGMVRPVITYSAFAFYVSVKWAQLAMWKTGGVDLATSILQIWGPEDRAIVILVLSYWFGQRSAKAAFGGSTMNALKGS